MSLFLRHRYIISRLTEAFEYSSEDEVEKLLLDNNDYLLNSIDYFLSANGPNRIVISCDNSNGNKVLQIHLKDIDILPQSAVYFIKAKGGQVDINKINDGSLSFGILKSPLESLDALIRHVYRPMLLQTDKETWGEATNEQKTEFIQSLDNFSKGLQGNIKSLNSGFELKCSEDRIETLGNAAASDPILVTKATNILNEWCLKIEKYLDDSDRHHWEDPDAGPDTELEYWKGRMHRLISITEQLKTKSVRSVVGLLNHVSRMIEVNPAVDQRRIISLITQWREVDIQITEAANESKDNVKYLSTLERFFQPLYSNDPTSIKDILFPLINAIKMIHSISRYYGTTERITKLFMKISNQIIRSSKVAINGNDPIDKLWDKNIINTLDIIEKCLLLNDEYQNIYHQVKNNVNVNTPKNKQFDFNEITIFNKINLFCKRLVKLLDLFSIIQQFYLLSINKFDNLNYLIENFNNLIKKLKLKNYNLFDYTNNKFDYDYIQFNNKLIEIDISLQQYINQSFNMNKLSIEDSLNLLNKYQSILYRDHIRNDLDSKLLIIFHNYGLELSNVEMIYERFKTNPLLIRNFPPVVGSIIWSRHLLRKIELPMNKFLNYKHILQSKESKKIIKVYNKIAKTLIAFEYLWLEAWTNSIDLAKEGLLSTLLIRNPGNNKLYVNFDLNIFQLIKESKYLVKIGVDIPESAKIILLQEDKYKYLYNELKYLIVSYEKLQHKILPIIRQLLEPHFNQIELMILPGLINLTWTSMNIDKYIMNISVNLMKLEELINKIHDIVENRIQKNLKYIHQTVLISLPHERAVTVEEFVSMQEQSVKLHVEYLCMKNIEIENAVYDLFDLILLISNNNIGNDSVPISPEVSMNNMLTHQKSFRYDTNHVSQPNMVNNPEYSVNIISQSHIKLTKNDFIDVYNHFYLLFYQAILFCIKNSLDMIKKRAYSKYGLNMIFKQSPFFEVDVQLSLTSIRLSPTLDDIQKAINKACVTILSCAKKIYKWSIKFKEYFMKYFSNNNTNDTTIDTQVKSSRKRESIIKTSLIDANLNQPTIYEDLGKDIDIVKTVLQLTGAMQGVKNLVSDDLNSFNKYEWLWKDDKEVTYKKFISKQPNLQDFESELKKFLYLEYEINTISSIHNVGVLSLNISNLKIQLINETKHWKLLYSNKVLSIAKEAMYNILEYMRILTNKLNIEVQSLDSLRYVMNILKEVREKESSIGIEVNPILDMYNMLEYYLPEGSIDKDDIEKKSTVYSTWRKVVDHAESVADSLSAVQGIYKKRLIDDIRDFSMDIKNLRKDFEESGPMLPSMKPLVAIEKLKKFKDELSIRERKMEVYRAGEELFALRPTRFIEIQKTKKEILLIDQLYSLYNDVITSIKSWSNIIWVNIHEHIATILDTINVFDIKFKKLPKKFRSYNSYIDLNEKISELLILFPLIQLLTKPSIKPRHWNEINNIILSINNNNHSKTIKFNDINNIKLSVIIDSNIVKSKDEIEDICDSADKQLLIEKKLNDIKDYWLIASFEFVLWKNRDNIYVLKSYGIIIEQLEEAQQTLQSLLTIRHVTPFREDVIKYLSILSDTSDTLEMWIKVQLLWTSLESVFLGGDIAKQMPLEAKKFSKINKDWEKLMLRAAETKLVVISCGNELLRTTLPILYSELEKCQKSLEGYLEQKRSKFPRFYFVSNPVLLLILSQGSDPQQMQPYYEKVFDSIDHVTHSKTDKSLIIEIQSIMGNSRETISLYNPVKAIGNIEDWLGELEIEMQKSMKRLCELIASECIHSPVRQFVNNSCGQFALLGLQIWWTYHCSEAINKSKTNKQVMTETSRLQVAVLGDLSSWCLEDLGTPMNRIKIETLITIQVHQRDVFTDLLKLYKEKKLSDTNDFEWLKQIRFYWYGNQADRHGPGSCVISICDVDYKYNMEYLGCKERLVITPLTDRCFITLSQAMGMCLGGAPAGPAGTGKTETVKDLGRALGVFVVVTNCTDQQRYTDMARIFKGLCQAGLWGCFDEFNRIELPVLSVVAQQILAITNSKRSNARSFTFPGDTQEIILNKSVGYFITMNPGYQGRQELPENLKVLFRGVAMMVPDREIIIKVKLCSVGYVNYNDLARKFNSLYNLCEQQLSKQKHYDFGLRNILSILRSLGQIKRDRINDVEDGLLMITLRDMNLSKLVAQDVPLFLLLLGDLFPSLGMPVGQARTALRSALASVCESDNLILHPSWTIKVIQLYETTLVRHGIMMVGPAGSGKSKIISTLQDALTITTGVIHKRSRMNPKAIRAEEMFGETDKVSGEWVDGIFATMWSKYNDRNRKDIHWIICDGPVDALWIENLNTVLDDNKILTLANGDRIPMTDNVKLLFEVEDLRNASPATVSRAGIIYVSTSDLDWEPILLSWLNKKPNHLTQIFKSCFKKYIGTCDGPKQFGHLFQFLIKQCKLVITVARVGIIENFTHLLDSLLVLADLSNSTENLSIEIERLFIYTMIWSCGGLLDQADRIKLSNYITSISNAIYLPNLKSKETLYDYYINVYSMEWERWVAPTWEYPYSIEEPDFSSLLVPTIESTKAIYLCNLLHKKGFNILITGANGTAKTSTILMFFDSINSSNNLLPTTASHGNTNPTNKTSSSSNLSSSAHNQGTTSSNLKLKKICFSSLTTPSIFQLSVESELDKRGGKSFGPPSGKKMLLFIDDISMPQVNTWNDQPTLELVRQLIENSGICFLDKDKRGDLKNIEDISYIAAMNHPSGGKQDIPNRLKRHFYSFTMILPSTRAINEIYGQMMAGRYIHESNPYFLSICDLLPKTTVKLWQWMRQKMLPSPTKFHYTFNLRDLSRVFQGILRTPKVSVTDSKHLLLLWRHECERVFSDKLTNDTDKDSFYYQLNYFTEELLSVVNPNNDNISIGTNASIASLSPISRLQNTGVPPTVANTNKNTSPKFGLKQKKTNAASSINSNNDPSTSNNNNLINKPVTLDELKDLNNYFVDFLRDDIYDEDGILTQEALYIYELSNMSTIKLRLEYFLNKYNEANTSKQMNIVLFNDAIRHLIRISRILGMPKGCILLVGVGGSGKQSLAKLATYCAKFQFFQISLSKSYNLNSFLEDIKNIYKQCGQKGEKTTFLFTESDIKDEGFLEILNSILTTGEVSNLFPKDELIILASELRPLAMKSIPNFVDSTDNLVKYFIDRVRSNLHIILCMSPISSKFLERARKFPGIFAGCTIDWYLPWPKEALIAVSNHYLSKLTIDNNSNVKEELIVYMGIVHKTINDICNDYYTKNKRKIYITPKSFISFLSDYSMMYMSKFNEINTKASRVEIGLEKLKLGSVDVEKMKIVLANEEVKLKESEIANDAMLKKLEISSMEAKKEADSVSKIKEICQLDAERISGEKADAEEDLAKAQPFVEEAERAVSSIKPNDLNELKKLGKPSDIIKLIFDCVSLLKMAPLVKVEPMEVTLGVGKDKKTFIFIKDSYKIIQSGMLSDTRFLANILQFSKVEKDFINDETIELMLPYLSLEGFNPFVARNASRAAEGLCTWCKAMCDYHEASKIVKPKLEALRLAEARLQDAERELFKAEMRLKACEDVKTNLKNDYEKQLSSKRAIEENALNTRKRMEQATSLISGLSSERIRWNNDREEFSNIKQRLVGDVALACAFVAYCGPFNQEFRDLIIFKILSNDLRQRSIPFTTTLDLTEFLADIGIIGDWNLEGLPTDPLSIQNGILVTRSSRYPLLIDPQGQGLRWIASHEEPRLPPFGITTFTNIRFRDQLEYCLAEGKALVVSGIEEEIDPMLTPILEKQIITKGKSKYILVHGKQYDYNDKFFIYLITRLPNPHYTPEDQSKCTIVDFTVTLKGLEDQLLGRVIQKEQKSLEDSMKNIIEELTNNTKSLIRLDQLLLERLSENTGNLLDDEELIIVLADTKSKAIDVKDKLLYIADMRKNINEKRELYRSIATRGSILYFSIVDLSMINNMYQISLDTFQYLFDKSIDISEKANYPIKRIYNIIDTLTYTVYRYVNRGLYEYHKISFKLLILLNILLHNNKINNNYVSVFIKAGNSLDYNIINRPKMFQWMTNNIWLNILQLSVMIPAFMTIIDDIERNENLFIYWFNENEPERFPIPIMEARWANEDEITLYFHRLLLIRCMREDRTILSINELIKKAEYIDINVNLGNNQLNNNPNNQGNNNNVNRLPLLGPKYIEPITDTVESIYKEMTHLIPVIYLLSSGADPTDSIEMLAKRKRKDIECISMGEGQDTVALRAINSASSNGSWVLLQNGHLGLDFIDTLEDIFIRLKQIDSNCSPDFRLFITTEPHPKFSIGLLQMSIKVTNEPPKGIRASLQRSYSVIIDQDRLERIESSTWRLLLYTICFLHSIVLERRKFGALGWCIPYEFNEGDLNATLMFLEKHLDSTNNISNSALNHTISWITLQYMTSEVQYGGRITDDLDRRLFNSYVESYLQLHTLNPSFSFNPDHSINKIPENFIYKVPDYPEIDEYMSFIQRIPNTDSPEILGLHPNADLTFRYKEVLQLLDILTTVSPKQNNSTNNNTSNQSANNPLTNAVVLNKEDIVLNKCKEFLQTIPNDYNEDDYEERIIAFGGFDIPLNIFLYQEIQRLQQVINKVRNIVDIVIQAINGEVVITADILESIDAIHDARVPKAWLYSPAGDELSWLSPTLSTWYSGLLQRDSQYRLWLQSNRPHSFWLGGFFNPQGFLTAIQQEITRAHKNENWPLDLVTLHIEITEIMTVEQVKNQPKEGAYIHGLFMDGASWNSNENTIVESTPKKLFSSVPVLFVTAHYKTSKKGSTTSDYGPFGGYDCPLYKYPTRTDKYKICMLTLPSRDSRPLHWVLRGVALLCQTN